MEVLHYYSILVAIVCLVQVTLAQNRNQECYELNIVGNIKSENYPQDYGNNQPDCWILRAEPGMNVQLTINDLDVEECGRSCGCDGIKIFNGDVSSLPNQQGCPLCGSSVPSEPITSTGDAMRVEFYSDGSATGAGFSAAFTSVYGPNDELPCYRYPQVPLPDGFCGAEKMTGILKNILHIIQDTIPETFGRFAYEASGAGVDIVSDEGIQQLACYMNGVDSLEDLSSLFFFSQGDFERTYRMLVPLVQNIDGDNFRQGLLSIRKLIHWMRRTGAPVLPLSDTTYPETWAFFTELQAEVPETFLADISPFASFIMGVHHQEQGPLPMGEFFTESPEELARVMHDINDDSSALYELFSTTESFYYSPLSQFETITSEDYHIYDIIVEPLAVAIFELEQVVDQLGWWNY